MDISCDIIRDLLPLYAEDLVSQDSRKLVDEHLCTCDPCTKQLGILKKAAQLPIEVEVNSLKRVGNTIRRRRILAVMTALLLAVTLVLSVTLLLDAEIYLTAEQAVLDIAEGEDQSIHIRWSDAIVGTGSLGSGDMYTDDPTGNYGIIAYTNLRKLLFPPKKTPFTELPSELQQILKEKDPIWGGSWNTSTYQLDCGASTQNFWYCDPWTGKGETLLWDAGNSYDGTPLGQVNFHLAYYCLILVGLAALCVLPAHRFKTKWYGELCARFSILFGCICLSVIIVSAGQFMEIWGEFTENFSDGFVLAVPMTLTALFARQLHRLNKQDKGL